MTNHLNHRATGKIRLVYLKDETVEVEGEIKLDSKGKIAIIRGKAELYVLQGQQEHMIPLEWDPVKQKFCYVLDENGKFCEDWSYWKENKYKKLLDFTAKTFSTCS